MINIKRYVTRAIKEVDCMLNDEIELKKGLNEDVVKEFGIMSVPTIVLLKDNKEVARNIGFIRKNDLESWISKNI